MKEGDKLHEINERVKELRTNLEMSQEEFGKKIGLSKSGISNIEKGTRSIRERHIKLICNVFNVNESWLTLGESPVFYLANAVKKLEYFINYLESLGYMIKLESEDETFTAVITKGKNTIRMSEVEFEEFQNTIERSVEFEIFKSSQK